MKLLSTFFREPFHSAAHCMNPLYTLCAPNGVHTNTLQTNTAWVLHITYNLCCTCTKGFTHHFGFVFIYFEAFILKVLIPFPQIFFQLFFTLSYKYQVISIFCNMDITFILTKSMKKISSFELWCFHRTLKCSWQIYVSNEVVLE